MPRDIIIPHNPKTAGTALRIALKQTMPDAAHLYDYGPQSPTTSEVIRSLRYEGSDRLSELRQYVPKDKPILVMGHFQALPYTQFFAAENFVTFLRDPVERVISDYKHHLRHYNYKGPLVDFARTPAQRNKQSFILSGLKMDTIGFAGLSELFESEIEYLSKYIGRHLAPQRINGSPTGQSVAVDDSVRSEIAELNLSDMALYEEAKRLREQRELYRMPDGPIAGVAQLLEPGTIRGWAVADQGRRIVPLSLVQNGKEICKIRADLYRRDLLDAGISQTGIGGFEFHIDDYAISPGPFQIMNDKICLQLIA